MSTYSPLTQHEEGAIVADLLQTCLVRIWILGERGAERLLGLLEEMMMEEDECLPVYKAFAELVETARAEMRSEPGDSGETKH